MDRFGLILRIGNCEQKFHLQHVAPTENPQAGANLVSEINPENHASMTQIFVKPATDLRSVSTAIGFSIDATAYAAWRKMNE